MYVWTGINVDRQLGEVKAKTLQIEKAVGFQHSNFTLPFHISLKMPFEIAEAVPPDVVVALSDLYAAITPFEILISGLEQYDNIVWIRMRKTKKLNLLHDSINNLLKSQFGIGLHAYDLDYIFHTTLFMDDNTKEVYAAYDRIKTQNLPDRLTADRFLIGTSKSGELGTYTVLKEVNCGI